MNPTTIGRPAKRVRQACEPCRRKKAKCPGEQPVCSLCARLQQRCAYSEEGRRSLMNGLGSGEPVPVPKSPEIRISQALEDRLDSLETKMSEVLDALGRNSPRHEQQTTTRSFVPPVFGSSISSSLSPSQPTPLPMWDNVLAIGELYLLYCDSQPLPLFHRATFLSSLRNRDPELIYAILALGVRFAEGQSRDASDLMARISGYTEVARSLVMKRISEGPVELSTLQCLCLLSLVDFTNGNTHRSSIHSSLAMDLAQCANLASESHIVLSPAAREERRRCFWSICLLKRLHGIEFDDLDIRDGSSPPYPESSTMPQPLSPNDMADGARTTDLKDQGIVAYVIMLSEVFAKTARYVRRHGKPTNVPPWSSQSEYSKIITLQMDLETCVPYIHRFKPASLSERTLEDLQANRNYWAPFFLNQCLYHTILCLLNHPLLLSLSLRNFRSTIPEIFLQHTSDLISSHTTWIIHFIKYFEEKSFMVSDPFLGYSAAVVATIELQLSFTENPAIRQEKRDRFLKCVSFVQKLGEKWPYMARLADRLQRLEDAVSASYQPESGAQSKSLLIDLSRFWEILEYSSNSDSDSARRMFGDSLYSEPPTFAVEVSQTSPLPEPFRLGPQQGLSQSSVPHYSVQSPFPTQYTVQSGASPRPDILDDEFSILAANFFSQGQEFLRNCDTRAGVGNF
ncbi:hypothetical protein BDV28DRAFT_140745 [Aspergillus coremiiformis]|uniref:Zn(2)-C6 fungal-type domain-containing protein n=1 Tax=Aspergillus coremiiformis TaxID=138285 RepID=A0A5N6YX18_9EURO|nr:hypothetical protein BDV28DRAFT_140745 [Aspergillus coremiiformis]